MSKDQHPDSVAGRIVTGTAIGLGAVAALAAVSAGAITAVFARTVLIPPRRRTEEVHILSHDESTITLSPTLDSMTPGRYSFWFHQTDGHARIGEIVSYTATSVTRELLAVDFGDLDSAKHGRFSGWFYLSPAELGFPFEDVEIATDLGPAPAWLIPAAQKGTRWVIQVHGRAVRRPEGLRAVPVFREAGYNSLLISYRNDGDAPESADNRYALGDTEWNDVAAAIRFAHARGAEQLVLMGWSMGGATVLQLLVRSPLSALVRGVVLDSPAVDWVSVLHFQGASRRMPKFLRLAMLAMVTGRWAGFITGQHQPIDLARLDIVGRAKELNTPILLFHSSEDGSVPVTASRALAAARPDLVTYEEFGTARHTKLWNYDSTRWNAVIARWLGRLK